MADIVAPEVRSRMMAGIRGKDTKPEIILRKGLHAAGFRYRLHDRSLPGKPDMVFPGTGRCCLRTGVSGTGTTAISLSGLPAGREFWTAKITRNREVDARSEQALAAAGWRLGIVWECALKGRTACRWARCWRPACGGSARRKRGSRSGGRHEPDPARLAG